MFLWITFVLVWLYIWCFLISMSEILKCSCTFCGSSYLYLFHGFFKKKLQLGGCSRASNSRIKNTKMINFHMDLFFLAEKISKKKFHIIEANLNLPGEWSLAKKEMDHWYIVTPLLFFLLSINCKKNFFPYLKLFEIQHIRKVRLLQSIWRFKFF